MQHVYGITGNKGHGKDTFARIVQGTLVSRGLDPFQIIHFAGELKRIAGVLFGLTDEQMNKQALKEKPLETPVVMDRYIEGMSAETGLDIRPAGMVAYTPRELMQFLGTEYVRQAKDSYWVDVVLRKIRETPFNVMVPDTRFPNEAEAIKSIGGHIIKIKRIDLDEAKDGHASETEMQRIEPDLFIGTVTDFFWLQERVALEISRDNFTATSRFDYRTLSRLFPLQDDSSVSIDQVSGQLDLPRDQVVSLHHYYAKTKPLWLT